ncbi:MAG: CBS domain-containing protein [Actinomycetota bacterium]
MKVSSIYEPGIMAAETGETLKSAAIRMHDHELSSLAVFERNHLTGIVTERDLARAIAEGADPVMTEVRDYMTEGVVKVSPETDVSEAAAMMLMLGARHLPVFEKGRMIGMVSARDLLHALTKPGARLE